jgi:hypothetical protein
MKSLRKTLLTSALFGASCVLSHSTVLYYLAGPQLVSDNNAFALPGLSLSRSSSATGTLCFSTASNSDTENYYAGMSFYDGDNNGSGWTFSNVAIAETFSEIAAVPEPSAALLGAHALPEFQFAPRRRQSPGGAWYGFPRAAHFTGTAKHPH